MVRKAAFLKKLSTAVSIASALLLGHGDAFGALAVTIQPSGADVALSWSGSINTADLTLQLANFAASSIVLPSQAFIAKGVPVAEYSGASGPTNMGASAVDTTLSTSSGDNFMIWGLLGRIGVPVGYGSGNPISGSGTFSNKTIATLGLTAGTYTYTWGSGGTADSVTVTISNTPPPAPVPTLSEWAMLTFAMLIAGFGIYQQRRRQS